MAQSLGPLGTYLAHSQLRLLNRDLKTICITNVTATVTPQLKDHNDIEFNTTLCSTHSKQVFNALLALQETRRLQPSPIQIPGNSTGPSRPSVPSTQTPSETPSRTDDLPIETDCLPSTTLDGHVYYLQADWIPRPNLGHSTAANFCSQALFYNYADCSNTFEYLRIRLTRTRALDVLVTGSPLTPSLSIKHYDEIEKEHFLDIFVICPNAPIPAMPSTQEEKIPPPAIPHTAASHYSMTYPL
jgi:hypothetical protein